MRLPTAGLAVALGLSVAECGLVLRNLLRGFGEGGVLGLILPMLALYLALGAACDLAVQRLAPAPWRSRGSLRGGAALALALALGVASGQLLFSLSLVLLAAGLFAWALHRPRLRWLALALALAGTWRVVPRADWAPVQPAGAAPAGPDIALIVLDTLRRDRCSTEGHGRPTTPALEALAARGARFTGAWTTAPWSLPAHGSLFTGELPSAHGAHNEHPRMAPDRRLLAEHLTAAGYQAAGFTANPFAGRGVGMARGFTWFEEHWRRFTLNEVLLGSRVLNGLLGRDRDKGGRALVASARRWWTQDRDPARPSFLFVNLMEPHGPNQEVGLPERLAFTRASAVEAERAGEAVHMAQLFHLGVDPALHDLNSDVLDGAVLGTDRLVAELLALVGPEALVVVVSDHGEMLGEQGYYGHNTGLWGPIVEVPLLLAGPGVPEGRVIDGPASIADVFPTLLRAAGVQAPPTWGWDLWPVLRGERTLEGRVVAAEHARTVYTTSGWRTRHPFADLSPHLAARRASTDGRTKRVVTDDGRDLGYDLQADPEERHPFDGATLGYGGGWGANP